MANFNLLRRIPIIHEAILHGNYPNKNTLRQVIAEKENSKVVSISTVGKIIDFLRDELQAPIEYNKQEHGYFYTDKSYVPPLYHSSISEKAGMSELSLQAFAKSIDVDYQIVANLADYGDLGIQQQGKFEVNLDTSYCGRNYYGGLVWVGLKVFKCLPNQWLLAVGFLDDYRDTNKIMTQKLQLRHQDYIAEDSPLDECYFLYHVLDKRILLQDRTVVQHCIWEYIEYIKKKDLVYKVESHVQDDKLVHENELKKKKRGKN